jgi:D-psicose/D-tagatose/L-ribulose 3-epimerase
MKFGANALIWTVNFTEEHFGVLPRLKAAGFDGIELPVFDPGAVPAAAIRGALADNGLEVTTCTVIPAGTSMGSDDAGARRKAVDQIKASIDATASIGGTLLAGPFYSPVGYLPGHRRSASEWAYAVSCFRELGPYAESAGVKLAIEPLNRFETYFLNTAADAARMCDEVGHPWVGILFDTFHANIEEKNAGAAMKQCGKHLFHVHTCENDRGAPGSGNVDWPSVFAAIREMKYDGWLTIESFGYNIKEIAAAACIWRDLAPLPENIAFDGLPYLKANVA